VTHLNAASRPKKPADQPLFTRFIAVFDPFPPENNPNLLAIALPGRDIMTQS
jgi:hypothetical protein